MAAGGSQIRCLRFGSSEAQSWVFARSEQFPWQGLVPFRILAGGWVREMALASAFVPPKLRSVVRGSTTNSPSRCALALPFSEQSC